MTEDSGAPKFINGFSYKIRGIPSKTQLASFKFPARSATDG
jgi:hypothetical protein